MSDYVVSARKYRPSTFQSVVGQKTLTQTLKRSIESQKLAHAYLFCGPRGVGKTTCARIFAKTINCMHPTLDGEACNECESCRSFNEQRSYNISEMDAASNNSVEDIRQLTEIVRIPPQVGNYKVFIIDEVHMLSAQAFNAFLKTLEEPPRYAIFILATTEKHKVLPTILSRCQIFDFHRITITDTIEHLKYVASQEGVVTEEEALQVIAQKADGGMRDALSIFDQMVSYTGGNVSYSAVIDSLNVLDYDYFFRLTDLLLQGAVPETLLLLNDVLQKGFDGQSFITGLSKHFRDLLVSKDRITLPLLEVGPAIADRYGRQAALCSPDFLYKALEINNECDLNYKQSKNKRLLVELTLIRLSQLQRPQDVSDPSSSPVIQKIPVQPMQQTASLTQQTPAPVSQPPAAVPSPQQPAPQQQNNTVHITSVYTAQPPKETPKPTLKGGHIPTISIRKNQTPNEQKQETPQQEQHFDTPFDQSKLHEAWKAFAQHIKQERVLYNTMLSCMPELKNATTFEVVVDNQEQLNRLNEKGAELLQHLRKDLRNSYITMTVRESEKQERQRAYSQREKFEYMVKENDFLLQFKDLFGLELA